MENALQTIQRQISQNTSQPSNFDPEEYEKRREVFINSAIAVRFEEWTRRRNELRIERSGLKGAVERMTFEAFKAPEAWQRNMKDTAQRYLKNPEGAWFVVAGSVGSGKTHICTAICGEMLKEGADVRYMLWRADAPNLKAHVNDRDEYERLICPLKNCKVLYIDDFWKGSVTEGDINLTFEILNARYINRELMTIISCERPIEEISGIDEAIGSRIYERSKNNYVRLTGDKNWRLK